MSQDQDDAADDFDPHLRRTDPDRWLSSRFIADEARRADVLVLYALDGELTRIPALVSQPMLGEIRLAWWREAVEEIFAGKAPRAHPIVQALARVIRDHALPLAPFETMIEARHRDLEPEPFADEAEARAYAEATAGSVMALVGRVLDPKADPAAFIAAGRAWGLAQAMRAGRLPRGPVVTRDIPRLSAEAFPAIAHVTFARAHAAGREPGEAIKRLKLVWAVAIGRP